MNIFRILASGKLGFREEHVSAFLAYLLNPRMDHGLHGEVLKRIADRIGQVMNIEPMTKLASRLEPKLRSGLDDSSDDDVLVDLEVSYSVPNTTKFGFIDIVVKTKECFLIIENKIASSSVTSDQVSEQYAGFTKKLRPTNQEKSEFGSDRPVISIYVVPAELAGGKTWAEPTLARDECAKINLQSKDRACMVTWQPTSAPENVSIIGILDELLADDTSGRISPISYDMRQLIRSFIDFTLNEFGGFAYQRVTTNKKIGQRRVSELLSTSDDSLYVGIQYGMAGLINRAWRNADFINDLVSVSDQENGWQYLRLSEFKIVATWSMDPSIQHAQGLRTIRWHGMPFWAKKLYVVAKATGDGIWIGIRGGLAALNAMSREEILNRTSWQVSDERKNTSWFSGNDFCEVLESKGISFDTAKEE